MQTKNLDFIFRNIMEKIYDTNNVYYIKNPASVFDEEKKLLEDIGVKRAHGNSQYGLEVLKNVSVA